MTDPLAVPPSGSLPARLRARFGQFTGAFWLINLIELFERGAYYTIVAVLAVHMSDGLGIADASIGLAFTALFALLYFFPVVAAALAEKYGYRASLIVSFALVIAGYATLLVASDFVTILGAILLFGLGAGVFKPIAASLVAQTTTEDQRSFGFMIYYAAINLGALLFPVSIGLVGVYAPALLETAAFAVATLLAIGNLAITILFFRNIRPPQRDARIGAAFASLREVLKDRAFIVLLAIYSGFWFLYAMIWTFLPIYMGDYARMPEWFNASLLAAVNPGVIVLAAPIVGRLTKGRDALALIAGGMALYAVGFVVMGFSATSIPFILGIVLLSVGEVVTHPSYLSYVSKIAPPDRVAVYLGYGFVPMGVGLTLGAMTCGILYGRFATEMGRPTLFWAVMTGVLLLTLAALLVHNRARARRAGVVAPSRALGFLTGAGGAAVAILLIPALVVGAAYAGPEARGLLPAATDDVGPDVVLLALGPMEGRVDEGKTVTHDVTLPANATGNATFSLAWTDEPAGAGATNAPDRLQMTILLSDGARFQSDVVGSAGGKGALALTTPAAPGPVKVLIKAVECGDEYVAVGPVNVPTREDLRASYALAIVHGATA